MPFERPRVRAEGPGGPDVKQGAKIACLDCRSAKIRCSAPTDGRVPCKRCARHGRECVFEKHRRGRKPGRTNNAKHDSDMYNDDYLDDASMHSGSHGSMGDYSGYSTGMSSSYGMPSPGIHSMASPNFARRHESDRFDQHRAQSSHHMQQQQTYTHSPYSQHQAHGNENKSNSWRQTIQADDPRMISPRIAGSRQLPASTSQSANQSTSQFSRPSLSPPHGREVQPGYSSYASQSSAQTDSQNGSRRALDSQNRNESDQHLKLHLLSSPMNAAPPSPRHQSNPYGGQRSASGGPYSINRQDQQPLASPPSSGLQSSSYGSGTTPGRSWLDFPTPGTRSLLSPSHLMMTSIGTFPSSNGSLPSAWPGSAITSPHSKRRGPTDYFAGAVPINSQGQHSNSSADRFSNVQNLSHKGDASSAASPKRNDVDHDDTANKKRRLETQNDERYSSTSREDTSRDSRHTVTSSASSHSQRAQFEAVDEEQVDRLGDDEMGGVQNIDVLSTPLTLLAHASDAALALRQAKGEAENAMPRPTTQGAATMGLLSPPVPAIPAPRKWFDTDRLPSMGVQNRGGLLPKLTSVAHRRTFDRFSRTRENDSFASPLTRSVFPPPSLSVVGRSKSYTAVEAAKAVGVSRPVYPQQPYIEISATPIIAPVTQSERRAEVLGIHTDVDGRQIEIAAATGIGSAPSEKAITASTLDPDAWEYRNGRVRSKQYSSGPTHSGSGTSSARDEVQTANQDLEARSPEHSSETVSQQEQEQDGKSSDALSQQNKFRARVGSFDTQRRWEVVRRRPSRPAIDAIDEHDSQSNKHDVVLEDAKSEGSSEGSEKLGASHQDFFSMGIFHSKMDNDIDLDPVQIGLIELSELESLFDIFFARINPLLTIFDPFLHSVTYVRNRSALLTTVIAALAARLSDEGRHAKLAVVLESHWRQKLLPEAILGGYKSVELAQAFLVLAIYHKPTNRLSEDRSWQYLGFAIRIATEIGVNRLTQPNDEAKDNEQVRRRIRNRHRLWISLWLTDRSLSLQTGRPATIAEDDLVAKSDLWHREDFALPEDARLVSLVKLTRTCTTFVDAFSEIIGQSNAILRAHPITMAPVIVQAQESIKSLNLCRLQAMTELERWKDIWCVEATEESTDGIQSLAISTFLDKWRPRAMSDLLYVRLHLNSMVLEAMERYQRFVDAAASLRSQPDGSAEVKTGLEDSNASSAVASTESLALQKEELKLMISNVALDCWETSLQMIDIVLGKVSEDDLSAGPNALAINVIYGALAALRLSNASQYAQRSWTNRDEILKRCKALAEALTRAGQTPDHRNGAAAPFGIYLKGITTLWETENVGVPSKESDDGEEEVTADTSVTAHSDSKESVLGKGEKSASLPSSNATEQSGANSNTIDKQVLLQGAVVPEEVSTAQQMDTNPITKAAPSTPSTTSNVNNATQQYSVGDEIWGSSTSSNHGNRNHHRAASGNVQGTSDAESMDRMWDYLTTYPDVGSTFPMSLWQPPLTNNNNLTSLQGAISANIPQNSDHADMNGSLASNDVSMMSDPNKVAAAAAAAAVVAANVNLNMATAAHPSAV
ncbi:uncharacterized protein FA14DRAFT_161780 [Meira miltonrushii]|uniref:Zn(2)-C6 fungal-type domain-containing protein n=1 Tax=Meira miltonrushii TaxID=1280837 RepID=A0A316V9R3_9BASI|nr:uncharacterized protein FA14DRAFT_161780 [Meira miltonrushii]PWN34359.1 hypothetical protein FA14DRAFT_161780 [Meira miltonrushii]